MKHLSTSVLLVSALLAAGAHAQTDNTNSTSQLRAEIEALRDRLDEIDASAAEQNRLQFSGDLRYRHDTINDDALPERSRHRIRARFNVEADLSDDIMVGISLATGGSNPVSANQTLGGFTRKDIGFDLAFVSWDINDELTLEAGKMNNPMFRTGGHHLIYDSDLNPEGMALGYDKDNVFANIGGFWVEERALGADAILYALQGGYRMMVGDGAELTIGASYYDYRKAQGYQPFYLGFPQGNSVDGAGNLLFDYDLAELFAQLDFEIGGQPLRLFLDYVQNTAADNFDTGSAVGLKWRNAANPGDWELGWSYEDLEADAVIATYTDSDFIGGGTDGKGHTFRAAYRLRNNIRFNATYFLNEKGAARGNERDYRRILLDMSFMF